MTPIKKIKKIAVDKLQVIVKKAPFNYKKHWAELYKKHGFKVGYCAERTKQEYVKDFQAFNRSLQKLKVSKAINILDVGCGIGMFTYFFSNNNFKNYYGVDLNGDLIVELKKKFPKFRFTQRDIIKQGVVGKYDLILFLDVSQHIVHDKNLKRILKSFRKCLNDNGVIMLTDSNRNSRDSFSIRRRELSFYKTELEGFELVDTHGFNDKFLYSFRRMM